MTVIFRFINVLGNAVVVLEIDLQKIGDKRVGKLLLDLLRRIKPFFVLAPRQGGDV